MVQSNCPASGPRFLLYSHDSWGLGHLRRSLTIAGALTGSLPHSSALIATGSPCATHFPLPERVDLIKLPSVSKSAEGEYVPRSLGGPLDPVLRLRRGLFLETFRAYEPDMVIVDHQVAGLHGEALPVLREAGRRGVLRLLGLRDVIDSPEAVARSWSSPACRWALTEGYDEVCVYGSPEIFDPREHYPLPLALRRRLFFSGYVVRAARETAPKPVPTLKPRVLVTMGGGEDGAARLESYLDAVALAPPDWESLIVAGPLLDSRDVRRIKHRARLSGGIEVRRFHSDLPGLLSEVDAVVSMAGYNTTAEILQSGCPVVFLPRTQPRREQEIRAEALVSQGLARSLVDPRPDELRGAIEESLNSSVAHEARPSLEGARNLCRRVVDLLGAGDQLRTASA